MSLCILHARSTSLQAQASGLANIYEACGSDAQLTRFYLALDTNLYPKLAEENARAVQGLNPKINVWNTGAVGCADLCDASSCFICLHSNT